MAGLHAVSAPVFLRYLERLDGLLGKLDAFAKAEGRDEAELLALSLQDGMLDLRRQVMTAMEFPLRALRPLATSLRSIAPPEGATIGALRAEIATRRAALSSLDAAEIDGKEGWIVGEKAGEAFVETDALSFVTLYALPNFFFHLVSAYAILRQAGVPIGKADFDGFHLYEQGFRFG